MKLTVEPRIRQKIFHLQAPLLASLDRRNAERAQRVFDNAYVYRLWELVPMLPTRAPSGWRSEPRESRSDLQNTFQTAALAFDLGIPRVELATCARDFRHFQIIAREAVRLFDLRIGPPWWVGDSDFLEMAYTAVMAQEEQVNEEMASILECYWGDTSETPQWMAESYMDWVHAGDADVINQCRWHYYNADGSVKEGKDPTQAELSMLLNWQVTNQPNFAVNGRDRMGSYVARTAHPHRAEERRLMRILNTIPRGRPQRTA